MTGEAPATDTLASVRREVERNALRARNGIRYLVGGRFARTGQSPRDLVWRHGKSALYRYRSTRRRPGPPIVTYVGLVGRAYVFDLYPGNSFVEKLLAQGLDAYVIDWGVPDEAESRNDIAHYALDLLPRALEAVLHESGSDDLVILGYCMGGCLTLASIGAGTEIPVRALALMATPTDFTQMGEFFEPIRSGSFDPEMLIDETGNVPGSIVRAGFRVRKPTADLQVYANLWQNLWNDRYMEAFQAMNEWVNEQVPFPGGAFREFVAEWLVGNGLVEGTLRVGGRPVDLDRIRCPVLCVIAEKDDIVPLPAAEPLPGLLRSAAVVETVRLPAGHVSLVTGRAAESVTVPALVSFLERHGGLGRG